MFAVWRVKTQVFFAAKSSMFVHDFERLLKDFYASSKSDITI